MHRHYRYSRPSEEGRAEEQPILSLWQGGARFIGYRGVGVGAHEHGEWCWYWDQYQCQYQYQRSYYQHQH